MIEAISFSKEWIEGLRKKQGYEKAHPEIMEKMIYALYLVERLVAEELDFTFKGGTCISLLIPQIRRFSIDVDIITQVKKDPLEKVLSKVVNNSRFTRYELDKKRSFINNIPKVHYDVFFISEFDGSEKNILLDVVFDEAPYPETVILPIENNLLIIGGNKVEVEVPTIDSITGDKLTAFAPNTIGIPYNTNKELQIIKQVYDIGHLFHEINNLEIVEESFRSVSKKQIIYKNTDLKIDDILQDIIETSFLIGMQQKNRELAKNKFDEIFRGVERFPAFLPNPRYNLYNVVEDSAKAALLAAKIKVSNFDALPSIDERDYNPDNFPLIDGKYSPILKMIKAMPNLSVFYWHHITKLIS
jgi:hypothetical protein